MTLKKVSSITLEGIEKRRIPSKHYVYVLKVTYEDNSSQTLFRRYNQFFDFQTQMLDLFPKEAGADGNRIIPFLPGKVIFGRSHIKDVAMRRVKPLAEYLDELLQLPEKISGHEHTLRFFEPLESDLNPPSADGVKRENKAAKAAKEKKPNVDMSVSSPMQLEQFKATSSYKRTNKTEMSLEEGKLYDIIEKDDNGWWFVSKDGEQGWAPATFLEAVQVAPSLAPLPSPVSIPATSKAPSASAMASKKGAGPSTYANAAASSKAKPANSYANSSVKNTPKAPAASSSSSSAATASSSSAAGKKNMCIATDDFTAESAEEVSFKKGASVEVIEKDPNGWWYVSFEGKEGWAPSTYLKPKPVASSAKNNYSATAGNKSASTTNYYNNPIANSAPTSSSPSKIEDSAPQIAQDPPSASKPSTATFKPPVAATKPASSYAAAANSSSSSTTQSFKLKPVAAPTSSSSSSGGSPYVKPGPAAPKPPVAGGAPKPPVAGGAPKPPVAGGAPKPPVAGGVPKPAFGAAAKPPGSTPRPTYGPK